MKNRIKKIKEEYPHKKGWYWLLATLLLFPILPEYLSLIFALVTFVVFKIFWGKVYKKALLGDLGKVFFVYMCYMVVSAFWSKTHVLSALIGLMWMGCFLIYVYMANCINAKEKLKNAITIVNVSAGIIGLIAIVEIVMYNMCVHLGWIKYEHCLPNPLYYYINGFIFDAIPVEIINYKFSSRASATFDNPLILATYLVTVAPFCAFGSVYFKHSKNRKISRVCLLLVIGGIVCTSSRGAYIAVALSIIVMMLTSKRSIFKKIFPFIILFAVAVPVGLVLRYKNTPTGDFLASTSQRVNIWKHCFTMFKENFLLGLGAGCDNIHTILRDVHGINRTHAHNLFLEMITEGGIIGGAFVIAIVVIIILKLVKLTKAKEKIYHRYAALYISSLLGFFVMSVFEFTLQSPKELLTMFMLLGFIEATYRIATNTQQITTNEILSYTESEEIGSSQPELINK
ncbi:MAG: O-antigen ligase family protein [Eubacterium sp.]|nr:O-antigen ligase family protein [Eubacterium sp.]